MGTSRKKPATRISATLRRVRRLQRDDTYPYLDAADQADASRVRVKGRWLVTLSTYGYLGLIDHPAIRQAAKDAVDAFGTGTHGVRILGGSIQPHEDLEERIARFAGRAQTIVYSSGYVANVATIQALLGPRDVVICDAYDHASIVDGCRLSGATFRRFDHNDMADLERCLVESPEQGERLVVVDAIYSMDGDIAPLPEILSLCRRHGARLMVDEAHSLGVLGVRGRGIEEHFGLEGAIDLKMGTLSKAIPSTGGYVSANADTITYLKHAARGFVFSAALSPPACAAALASFEVLEREGAIRCARLTRNADRLRMGLTSLGFDTGRSTTPIVPVMAGSDTAAFRLSKGLRKRGVLALPVVSPAVPSGGARIRASVTAAHDATEIDHAVTAFAREGRSLGLIPKAGSPAPRRAASKGAMG